MNKCPDDTILLRTVKGVMGYLQRAPAARGFAYLSSAVLLRQAASRVQPTYANYNLERFHLSLAPFVAATTYGFARLRPEDRARWTPQAVRASLAPALVGAGIGAGAILSFFLVGRARGWLDTTEWGWERCHPTKLAGSVALIAVGQLAVAWNEETIFRGYSYATLRLAAPPIVVAPFLTVLFGYAHSYDPWVAWHEAAIGTPMMLLRLASGGIAAPVGYHWAWNFLQSGIFGPTDGAPSLRPIRVQGPPRWIGRPGYAEPGWLSSIVSLAVAAGIGLWMYQQQRKQRGV